MIPVYKPYLSKNSLKYATDAIESTWLANGKYVSIVEDKLCELLKVNHVIAVNNGTSATHLVSKSLHFKYPNISHLIVPNNCYIAAINSFLFDEDYYDMLHPIDADPHTWNISNIELEDKFKYLNKYGGNKSAAILIVHNLGNIYNIKKIKEMGYVVVEDNCEGLFGKYGDRASGTESLASSISFFGNKNITCGEGGAFITNDSDVYEYIKCIQGQGQSEKRFVHKHLGYNYRMTNVAAAMLLGQLEIYTEIMDKKAELFYKYKKAFEDIEDVYLQHREHDTEHSKWMMGIKIDKEKMSYDLAEVFFRNKGIEIRPMFYSIREHLYLNDFRYKIHDYKDNIAKMLNQKIIILPSYPGMTDDEFKRIRSAVFEFLGTL